MEVLHEVKETTATDLGALLDAGDGSIVTLVAGDTRLAAHKAVLADRSPVFAAMFQHDMLEASSGQVVIPDVEGSVLRQLLAYLYTLKAPQLPDTALQLLAAADKYGVSSLKEECEQQVTAQLSVETAAAAAVFAVRHSCTALRQAAVAFIKDNLEVLVTEGWVEAVHTQPEAVVELNRLLFEKSTKQRAPTTAARKPTPSSQQHSGHARTPASAAAGIATCHPTPPDDAAVSRMRRLSGLEKGRKMIEAAKKGAVDDLQTLLAAGADVDVRDTYHKEDTPLHWAARRGYLQAVECLLRSGAEVDARNNWQSTPLLLAAQYGHKEVVALLLRAGADAGARDADGDTPLALARQYNHLELVEMLR